MLKLLVVPYFVALLHICGAAVAADVTDERLHIVIPAGPGGGLDATARAIGRALVSDQEVARVSYENRTGGGGGKAMAYFVESNDSLRDTLLVNSTPLLIRSLQGLFPHSYKDLTPLAGLIADPGVIAVRADSPYQTWADVVLAMKQKPGKLFVGGGSVKGSLDHIILSLLVDKVGIPPRSVRYLPYDGGGKAMLALLSGEVDILVSGLGETLSQQKAGSIVLLGMTAEQANPTFPQVPTFKAQQVDVVFYNWRGLFAPSSTEPEQRDQWITQLSNTVAGEEWQLQLARYGWQPLFLPGDEFVDYLSEQEIMLKAVLLQLGLVR
ncbi:MAG: putative tricarboxylic transport membrane protein [Candidatus Azotimanducaceae bacterium]|jgi:putative tricarboxylic transport membrane protein|tara:strand:- start:45404 stop:46375 length:972 start_codon:yes stop_codon:yes gene_type:complete